LKIKIIDSRVSDSSDNGYFWENGIHNTLRPIWAWADENKVDVSFEKFLEPDESGAGLRLEVYANFTSKEDMGLYKLSFNTSPMTKMVSKPDLAFEFTHGD